MKVVNENLAGLLYVGVSFTLMGAGILIVNYHWFGYVLAIFFVLQIIILTTKFELIQKGI